MTAITLRVNENQIGVVFTIRALFELSCLLETNEVNKTLIPQQDDYLTLFGLLTYAGITGYNHKHNQQSSISFDQVLCWVDAGVLTDEHYLQVAAAFEASKRLPNEPEEDTAYEASGEEAVSGTVLTWKGVFVQSAQAGILLHSLYNMYWWEFVLSYEGYKERELDKWRRTRLAAYTTYISNWGDPKRKPVTMAKFLPLKGDQGATSDFGQAKREWEQLKMAAREAMQQAREKQENTEYGKGNSTD